MVYYSIFKTLWGWMGAIGGEAGIKQIVLPHPTRAAIQKVISLQFPAAAENRLFFKPLTLALENYFQGKRIRPNVLLDYANHPRFFVNVWKAAQRIPWGEVRTYQWLSAQMKKPRAFRAVGTALGKNPFPIVVPCHRVIRADGQAGGFSAPGGTEVKQKLLALEGVTLGKKSGIR